MGIQQVTRVHKELGLLGTIDYLSCRVARQFASARLLYGIQLVPESMNRGFIECPPGFQARFLERSELLRLAQQVETGLHEEEVEEALARGDECFALLERNRLATYTWQSRLPTPISKELVLHFAPGYIYRYRAFTLPAYRGQRLNGVGATRALEESARRGCKGFVAYVEADNLASLKSCWRMGYRRFGTILYARLWGKYFIHSTAGCRAMDFYLKPRAA